MTEQQANFKLLKNIFPKKAKEAIKIEMLKKYTDYLDDSNCLNTTELVSIVSDYFGDNPEDGSPIDELYYEVAVELDNELFEQGLINQ